MGWQEDRNLQKDPTGAATSPSRSARWTYSNCEIKGKPAYTIRAGNEIVATVASRGDADMICRLKVETARMAFDVRRNLMKIRALSAENRMLLGALRRVASAMQRSSPSDISIAKNEVNRILKQMRTRGNA